MSLDHFTFCVARMKQASCALDAAAALRVLVVEDNPGDVDLVREALAHANVVVEAVDRVAAVEPRLAASRPDLILLDLGLPDCTGLETLERVRALAPEVPIIVLTGSTAATMGARAARLGADDYLTKQQITSQWLSCAVNYAVERHRSREREKLLVAERAARMEAERASRSKDEFLALLSHELRNPLAPVRFALALLKQPDLKDSSLRRAYGVIDKHMHRFVRLVEDLLEMACIAQDKLVLHKEGISLAALMQSAVDAVSDSIRSAQLKISVTGPARDMALDVDGARIIQVLTNLLDNAIKFTPAGGHIWLSAERVDSGVLIGVRDTGVGFSPEAAPRIFDMFHGDSDSASKESGLGIGLALAKRLVELHGGSLEARSEGKDSGAEFRIRLPASPLRVPQQPGQEAAT